MLKFCISCEKQLTIDLFFTYEKSICKQCLKKEVKCDYCGKEFNGTNFSKHIKESHNTFKSSRTSDSTYDNSRTNGSNSNRLLNNDSTSKSGSEHTNDCTYYNLSDHKIIFDFINTRKNNNECNKEINPKQFHFLFNLEY